MSYLSRMLVVTYDMDSRFAGGWFRGLWAVLKHSWTIVKVWLYRRWSTESWEWTKFCVHRDILSDILNSWLSWRICVMSDVSFLLQTCIGRLKMTYQSEYLNRKNILKEVGWKSLQGMECDIWRHCCVVRVVWWVCSGIKVFLTSLMNEK